MHIERTDYYLLTYLILLTYIILVLVYTFANLSYSAILTMYVQYVHIKYSLLHACGNSVARLFL